LPINQYKTNYGFIYLQENEKNQESEIVKFNKVIPGEVNHESGLANVKSIESVKSVIKNNSFYFNV
jgi:hypothetical protein